MSYPVYLNVYDLVSLFLFIFLYYHSHKFSSLKAYFNHFCSDFR